MQKEIEHLDERIQNEIAAGVSSKLITLMTPGLSPTESIMELITIQSSTAIIKNFRTIALRSYRKNEFLDESSKEFIPFIDRDLAITPGYEIMYHQNRMDYINRVLEHIEKNPVTLKTYEQFLLRFFQEKLFRNLDKSSLQYFSNCFLQFLQLENNISDLYTLLSIKKFRLKDYITGIDDEGRIYSKPMKKMSYLEIPSFYMNFHSHAPVLFGMNSEKFQDLIPDDITWARDPSRLEDCINEYNCKIGFHMLEVGQENKHFHSSLPHKVIIKDRGIDYLIVKDDPPHNIYFSTVFKDGSASLGVMSTPYENGKIIAFQSDLLSDIFLNNKFLAATSYFLFDIAGCIARDMFVCEEKDKFYNIQEVGARQKGIAKKPNIKEKIIWLPRFKINLLGRRGDQKYISEQLIKLSPAHVSGHPRRCKNPSQKQVELARNLGIVLPPEFTYVREYDRGESHEFRRLYKSRSAMNLVYGAQD